MRGFEGALFLAAAAAAGCAAGPSVTVALAESSAEVTWSVEAGEIEAVEEGLWPWREGRASLGGQEFRVVVRDARRPGAPGDLARVHLAFDRDGDGTFDADEEDGEGYRGDGKFNLGTGTFRLADAVADGSRITLAPAWPGVDPRPFLGVGDPAPPLPPRDLEGRPITWEEFRGRKVLLVFWASW